MAFNNPLNRGYAGGLAARGQAGSRQGSSFGSSFNAYSPPVPTQPKQPPALPLSGMPNNQAPATTNQAPGTTNQALPPAFDPSGMFAPAPLPSLGSPFQGQPPAAPLTSTPAPLPDGNGPRITREPMSPFGVQPLPSFGGFRAQGGPVMPGRAYMVGERGPELILPQQPGTVVPNHVLPPPIRSPMAPQPSPMNRSYGGGIADRGPVQQGRSGYDLNRIAERNFRQTKDPSMLLTMDYRNLMRDRMQPPAMPDMPPPMPPAPLPPAGQFVPGRSTGSQVWQPALMPPTDTASPTPMSAPPMPMQAPAASAEPVMPRMPFEGQTPGLGMQTQFMPPMAQPGQRFDPTAPLPPSSFNGALGVPPPPALDIQRLGDTGYGVPFINGQAQKQFLPMPPAGGAPPPLSAGEVGRINAAGFEPYQVNGQSMDARGVPYVRAKQAPMETVTRDAEGNVKSVSARVPQGSQPAAAAAPKSYFDQLLQPPATQTGQMPNTPHLSPRSPEEMLAAAREDYARTGNDAALREYFKQYPSEAVRYGQKETQLWQQIGQMPTDNRQQMEQSVALMREADRLNAQARAAAQGMPVPADYATDPDRRPLLPAPAPYLMPQQDPFLVQAWQGANSAAQDLTAAMQRGAQNLVAYGKQNPLITFRSNR